MKGNSYYKQKRKKAGVTPSDIAKELGIDYKKYSLIENGVIKMPANLIDKFNEIVGRTKNENVLNKLNNEELVNTYWEELSKKRSSIKGDRLLFDKMKEFNIQNVEELARLLGVSRTLVQGCLNGRYKPTYNFKNNVYTFFTNELNIQEPKNKEVKKRALKLLNGEEKELIKWFNKTDFKKFMEKNGVSYKDIGDATGLTDNFIWRFVNKVAVKPKTENLLTFKKYYDEIEGLSVKTPKEEEMTFCEVQQELYSEVLDQTKGNIIEDMIKTYEQEIVDNSEVIAFYTDKIKEVEVRNATCNEIIQVLNKIRGE